MDMEEPTDFKSVRERFQFAGRCNTLPANFTKTKLDETAAPNICNVRSNPALQGVISVLENQTKPRPPIAKKPELPAKPNGLSFPVTQPQDAEDQQPIIPRAKLSADTDSMKLGFRQTWHVIDSSNTGDKGLCRSHPQVYRLSSPKPIPPPLPQPITEPQDWYEEVGDHGFPPTPEFSPITDEHIKSVSRSPERSISNKMGSLNSNYAVPSHGPSPKKDASSSNLDGIKGKPIKPIKFTSMRTPNLRSLPSIESLGPPPPKQPRPPKVDLGPFLTGPQKDVPDGQHEVCSAEAAGLVYEIPPPSPVFNEGECYEEAIHFQKPADDETNVYELDQDDNGETSEFQNNEEYDTSPIAEEETCDCYEEILKLRESMVDCSVYEVEEIQPFPDPPPLDCLYEVSEANKDFGFPAPVIGSQPSSSTFEEYFTPEELDGDSWSLTMKESYTKNAKIANSEKTFRKKFKVSGQETPMYTAMIMEDFKAEKYTLPVKRGDSVRVIRITDCPTGKWLAQDETGRYGFVPVACVDISKDVFSFHNSHTVMTPVIPDFSTGTENSGAGSDVSQRSDSCSIKSDDTYDDIGSNNVTSNASGKNKGFGVLFRKDKSKKEHFGSGYGLQNINAAPSQKSTEPSYGLQERGKEERPGVWKSIFHTKEQRARTESLGTEGKLSASAVMKKFSKEEKSFRDKFKYTGEIKVMNIAIVNDLAPITTKDKMELAVTPGETIEVIDVINEDQIICRNLAGKYGYVGIEYLNFQPEHFQ